MSPRTTQLRRRRIAFAAALALTLLAPGTAALAAGADTITVHERNVDTNPASQNPCTGAMGTVVDINDIHFHITTLANGTINETGHNTATVTFTPEDPTQPIYEGHETYALGQTTSSKHLVTTTTFHLRMKGTDGSFFTIHEVAHSTITPVGMTSTFDTPTLSCT